MLCCSASWVYCLRADLFSLQHADQQKTYRILDYTHVRFLCVLVPQSVRAGRWGPPFGIVFHQMGGHSDNGNRCVLHTGGVPSSISKCYAFVIFLDPNTYTLLCLTFSYKVVVRWLCWAFAKRCRCASLMCIFILQHSQ